MKLQKHFRKTIICLLALSVLSGPGYYKNIYAEEAAASESIVDPSLFEGVGAPRKLGAFLDFRKTDFTVTLPENEESPSLPEMTIGKVSFSDRNKEIQSCSAEILYETNSKTIFQITVYAPDAVTLDSARFQRLFSTIIQKMGIVEDEATAIAMVTAVYESEEPIVMNDTYLHLNRTGNGFMIKY